MTGTGFVPEGSEELRGLVMHPGLPILYVGDRCVSRRSLGGRMVSAERRATACIHVQKT